MTRIDNWILKFNYPWWGEQVSYLPNDTNFLSPNFKNLLKNCFCKIHIYGETRYLHIKYEVYKCKDFIVSRNNEFSLPESNGQPSFTIEYTFDSRQPGIWSSWQGNDNFYIRFHPEQAFAVSEVDENSYKY